MNSKTTSTKINMMQQHSLWQVYCFFRPCWYEDLKWMYSQCCICEAAFTRSHFFTIIIILLIQISCWSSMEFFLHFQRRDLGSCVICSWKPWRSAYCRRWDAKSCRWGRRRGWKRRKGRAAAAAATTKGYSWWYLCYPISLFSNYVSNYFFTPKAMTIFKIFYLGGFGQPSSLLTRR